MSSSPTIKNRWNTIARYHIHIRTLFLLVSLLLFSPILKAQKPELVVPVGHQPDLNSICFSKNRKYLLTTREDKTVKLGEVASGKEIRTYRGAESKIY